MTEEELFQNIKRVAMTGATDRGESGEYVRFGLVDYQQFSVSCDHRDAHVRGPGVNTHVHNGPVMYGTESAKMAAQRTARILPSILECIEKDTTAKDLFAMVEDICLADGIINTSLAGDGQRIYKGIYKPSNDHSSKKSELQRVELIYSDFDSYPLYEKEAKIITGDTAISIDSKTGRISPGKHDDDGIIRYMWGEDPNLTEEKIECLKQMMNRPSIDKKAMRRLRKEMRRRRG